MARIKFNLEDYKAHPGWKVETRDGHTVRILCYDKKYIPIVALVGENEDIILYDVDGTAGRLYIELPSDLFLVTSEPEQTEFELALGKELSDIVRLADGEDEDQQSYLCDLRTKTIYPRLLDLARKEIEAEQKPAEWSAEDEKRRQAILQDLANIQAAYPKVNIQAEYDWLKSLHPQSKE